VLINETPRTPPKATAIGVPDSFFFDNVDEESLEAIRAALFLLRDMKAQVDEVSLPHAAEAPSAWAAITLPEALAYHRSWLAERPDDYGEDVRGRLELAALLPAVTYVEAQRLRPHIGGVARPVFDRCCWRCRRPLPAPLTRTTSDHAGLTRFTGPFNLAGLPAISIPASRVAACHSPAAGWPMVGERPSSASPTPTSKRPLATPPRRPVGPRSRD
jgi:aspartyl-tRNA(Asn)/glutamyl-tRNA(Gln) amidotransferase subunit A